jgi:hypothetical protein
MYQQSIKAPVVSDAITGAKDHNQRCRDIVLWGNGKLAAGVPALNRSASCDCHGRGQTGREKVRCAEHHDTQSAG